MGKEKQKIALLIVGGIVAGALISWQGIWKTNNNITSLKSQISDKQRDIDLYNGKIAKIPGKEKELEDIQDTVEQFSRILPDNAVREEIRLTRLFEEFSAESGIEFDKLEAMPNVKAVVPAGTGKPLPPAEDFEPHKFQLTIKGHFFDVVALINRIERSEKFIKIDSFTCKRIEDKAKRPGGDLTYLVSKIVMSFYTYVPSVVAAAK